MKFNISNKVTINETILLLETKRRLNKWTKCFVSVLIYYLLISQSNGHEQVSTKIHKSQEDRMWAKYYEALYCEETNF